MDLSDSELDTISQSISSGKLDPSTLPTEKRANLRRQMVAYQSRKSNPEQPGVVSQTANFLSGGDMGQSPTNNPRFQEARDALSHTRIMSALDAVAKAGKMANQGVQDAAGYVAEKSGKLGAAAERAGYPGVGSAIQNVGAGIGTAAGTISEALAPKDRLSALATIAGLAPGEAAEAKSSYNVPTKTQRVISEVMGVQSNVKPQHIAAVIANPEIMSDATPSMREVGKEYTKVFDRLGMEFDGKAYKEITGMRYPPNETQAAKLKTILQEAAEKLETMKSRVDEINSMGAAKIGKAALKPEEALTPAEAFLARSAGKKLLTGTVDANVKRLISSDVGMMDDFLENSGVPEIKELSHKYFRAAAKESLSEAIPKLRNGNPAVVRSMIMAHYGKEAALALAEGKPVKAVANAATGAVMSPWVQGKAIPFLAGPTNPNLVRAGVVMSPNLQALQNGQ